MSKRIALAMTGGSGVQYALRLIQVMTEQGAHVYLMLSSAAVVVINTETDYQVPASLDEQQRFFEEHFCHGEGSVELLAKDDWFSAPASGSNAPEAMVICPASGGTLSAVSIGASNNLIERAADVMLKERRPLVLVPRETPLSRIHLTNMLTLTEAGAIILPASPGFYNNPRSIEDLVDFVVARIVDHLGFEQKIQPKWGK